MEGKTIPEYYAGKNILVTGATGFMGKVLVEKLLRCCPDIARIYVLMRNKKGQDIKERVEGLLNCQVFDRLRTEAPLNLEKILGVRGDVLIDGLGLSDQDRLELRREINIVFHCAANVRFDMKLQSAVLMNTMGTRRVLSLVETMTNLQVFVHVSTAYCHCDREVLEEVAYSAAHDPDKVLDVAQWMDDEMLELITPKMIGGQPNTYAYSKSLSEDLVARYGEKFPCVIARPSIVTAAWQEPMPGWVDNLNGPTGLLVGAGKGVIRTMHCQEHLLADIVPVDFAINALIALAWRVGITRPKSVYVCNVTESGVNPLSWGKALELGRKHVYAHPFSVCLWYPGGSVKASRALHELCVLLLHALPAYFIDALLVVLRKKTFMVKLQKRISGGLELLQYYTTKEWKFNNDNLVSLHTDMGKKDAETFYTNLKQIDWDEYLKRYILGARQYCCKEDPSTLPKARKLMQRLYYLNTATSAFLYALFAWLVYAFVVGQTLF